MHCRNRSLDFDYSYKEKYLQIKLGIAQLQNEIPDHIIVFLGMAMNALNELH